MSCGWTPSSTNDRTPAFSAAVPMMRTPGNRANALGAVGEQVVLVARDRARGRSPRGSRSPPPARSRRRCSACRPRTCTAARSTCVFSKRDRADHVAAALVRRHRLEQRRLAVEHADAGRAVDLVPGERVEIAVERLHVDRQVRHRLRAVDQHRDTAPRRGPARSSRPTGLIVPSAFDTCATATIFVAASCP